MKLKTNKTSIACKPLSKDNEKLARRYAKELGYKIIINNGITKSAIFDENKNMALLTENKGNLYMFYKGNFEPITKPMVGNIIRINKVLPKTKKVFPVGILRYLFANIFTEGEVLHV